MVVVGQETPHLPDRPQTPLEILAPVYPAWSLSPSAQFRSSQTLVCVKNWAHTKNQCT